MSTRTLFLRAPAGLISGRLPLRALWINLSLLLGGAALLTLAVSLGALPLS
ncbi:iron-enterobactin ABC transporter permease, partial [Dickeya dianthicola]|nr:iron-enterobactin ABC transporter permease [Dickeya dianthicola]MBI0504674.1 iron-enterobactin ABC transporter permease [Dickeya dianthicola]